MRSSRAGAIAGGGRFTPSKPTLARNNSTTFTISNYDAANQYTLSVNSGTVSRSGNLVTLSAPNAICTVVAAPPKGVTTSAQSAYEVKAYTYTTRWVQTSYQTTPGMSGPFGGSGFNSNVSCTYDPGSNTTGCSYGYNETTKDSLPSGFTDSGTEWFKAT